MHVGYGRDGNFGFGSSEGLRSSMKSYRSEASRFHRMRETSLTLWVKHSASIVGRRIQRAN